MGTGAPTGPGVIVAGGRSARFGAADKAVADLAGTPMIRRVADRIAGAVDGLVVNCRAGQVGPIREALAGGRLDPGFAVDPEPDRGPAAGVRNGLRAVGDGYAFVVACDMPFVDPALARHLFAVAEGHDAAVPRTADGWLQPTQAVYRAEPVARACDRALERGDGTLVDALADLDCAVVDEAAVREHAAVRTFENVNTRAELEAAAARL